MRRLALPLVIGAAFFLAGPPAVEADAPLRVELEWRAPTEGSPVALWEVQFRATMGQPPLPAYDPVLLPVDENDPDATAVPGGVQNHRFPVDFLQREIVYEVRIRGFDVQGRPGTWTPWHEFQFPHPSP
jgi:hypothetical protein